MVARLFLLRHNGNEFPLEYDTDDGFEVLKFQVFSLTSIPPDEQQIVIEEGNLLVTEASDLAAVSDKLCLLSVQDVPPEAPVAVAGEAGMSDEELARLLQAEEEALYLQQLQASGSRREFEERVRTYVPQVLLYEDPVRQEASRKTVPVDEIEEKSLVSLAKEGSFKPSKDEKDHTFLLELLFWFKRSFRWVNLPPCDSCGGETRNQGMGTPLASEIQYGASRVEIYSWNKKLNYLIAISKDGVYDVTKRYTRKWHEVLSRRTITTEAVVSTVLSDITKECRSDYSSEVMSMLEHRDRTEVEELETNVYLQDDASLSLPGRQSGAKEWRIARSELGSDEKNSLSSSSCPIRKCFDDHVTRIYTAFSLLLLHLSEQGTSNSEAVQILEAVGRLLLDLKTSSFKQRKAFLDSSGSPFFKEIVPTISTVLDAMSLKGVILPDHRLSVSLSGDPIQTALALPVASDVVEEIIDKKFYSSNSADNSLLCFSKFNRISSGTVLASGEELPFGIATSAFDGISKSKWEEPNGARGCWLLYKTVDGKMTDLEEYELMSANDAPERDPADWILEGSADGGCSWFTLDTQRSQQFDERFQRKTYKIKTRISSNAFRFRFLRVRDSDKQSRFQIGGIDLFGQVI
ncbi:hypothetical protein Taro_055662 [Colocasia esculenta]|uniref:Rad4/PNGase transglutaminase-like fold domain-containing protein n=1 Tax=Colocasia esculenta TaxID=4460 RepID=A0A843XRJ9_COLES|nr:hypothetical protein [Colocasia esculenta]